MKKVFVILLIAAFSTALVAQTVRREINLAIYGVGISPDKRLIAVMVALEIGGIDTPLIEKGEKFRSRVRNDFKGISPQLRQQLLTFVEQYKKRNAKLSQSEIVAAFVTLAYSLSEVPALRAPERSVDLPDDLLEVLDFASLVAALYQSPGVAAKIDGYYRENLTAGNGLKPSAREMVRDILDYLHTKPELVYIERVRVDIPGKKKLQRIESREYQRSFKIVPAMLAPKGTVNFLNIRDSYFAIIPPEIDLSASDVRRAYLQFVLDPLVLKNARTIIQNSEGIKKLLEQRRKAGSAVSPDVVLAVSRSLVAAADAREEEFRKVKLATSQARRKIELLATDAEKRSVVSELDRVKQIFADESALQLSESYEKGAVLAFYFAQRLKGLEDSGFDVASSLTDWITSIDISAEEDRLAQNADARKRALAEREKRRTRTVVETTLVSNPLTEALLKIDKDIEAKKLAEAEKSLNSLLKKYPMGATRIYYSLGRVASKSAENLTDASEVNKRLIKAKDFFEKALGSATINTDKELISLTYVSLGRIYEFYDQKDYAVKIYEAAMQYGSADGEGFKRAFEAKRKIVGKN